MKFRHVLVPLDHSPLAEAALDYAVDLVHPEGLVTLITVVEPPGVVERDRYPGMTPSVAATVITGVSMMPTAARSEAGREAWDNARLYLDRVADSLQKPYWFVQTRIEEGRPAERILEVAHELKVDAIVMSTHGRSGLSRWVFGSVAQKVISAAECPVLLIPQRVLSAK